MTFIEAVVSGKATQKDINDWISLWHKGETEIPLHEFLGMNRREYAVWLTAETQAVALDVIVNKHRQSIKQT